MGGLLPKIKELHKEVQEGRKPHLLKPHGKGAADVDMFPFLELYARLSAMAHRPGITHQGTEDAGTGFMPGLRCHYNLLNAHDEEGESLGPTAVLLRAEERGRGAALDSVVARRRAFRQLLEASTSSALAKVKLSLASPRGASSGSPQEEAEEGRRGKAGGPKGFKEPLLGGSVNLIDFVNYCNNNALKKCPGRPRATAPPSRPTALCASLCPRPPPPPWGAPPRSP